MNRLGRGALAWVAMLNCLMGMVTARAESFDLGQLMQLLAASPSAEVSFTEKKFSSLLSAPVVSSGKLVYRRPDLVEKNMDMPRKESYRFVGEELVVTRNGAERRIPLSSQPLLSAFAASLRGALGGDLALLQNHYRLSLQGDASSWRLDMIPIDDAIVRYVQRITVSGRGGKIGQIETRETSGDLSVLQVR
jgi:hypothetical protein